jgi:hypothetical protein
MERRRRFRSGNGLLAQLLPGSERQARILRIQGGAAERGSLEGDTNPKRKYRDRHRQQPGFCNTEESQTFFLAAEAGTAP